MSEQQQQQQQQESAHDPFSEEIAAYVAPMLFRLLWMASLIFGILKSSFADVGEDFDQPAPSHVDSPSPAADIPQNLLRRERQRQNCKLARGCNDLSL